MKRLFAWMAAATLAAACGGNVVVDKEPLAGSGGTGGEGGAGVGGASPGKICGGKQGLQCAADEWCQWDVPGSCGIADQTGTCQPRPEGCPADCPGACGCDGAFYCNACEAHSVGLDTTNNIPGCGTFGDAGAGDTYAAFALPTGAPRYAITKADHDADLCTQITMIGFGGPSMTNVETTMGWQVEKIAVINSAAACADGAWPLPPGAVFTDIAKGVIKQDDPNWPCTVDVDVSIGFPPNSPAWVPGKVTMQAFGLTVGNGGCEL